LSAERLLLRRAPSSVRAVPGSLDAYLAAVLDSERAAARAAGRAEGEAAAFQAGAGRFAAAALRLDQDREAAREKLSNSAAALAIVVARSIARAEVSAGRHDMERLVREVLAAGGIGRAPCQVHLNPADAARLADTTFRAGTEIVADVGVARGDVQIETPQGLLVHDLDEALVRLATRLEQELK
jgi:flagellar biosynthesis/type III secretory pathway protein FliH